MHTSPHHFRRRHARPAGGGRSGFTLVEVLATLLMIAIALPAIMHVVSISTNAASAAKRRNEATALAESQLAELVATGAWTSGASLGGPVEGWPDYFWAAEVLEWPEGGAGVQELNLRVSWLGPSGQEQGITVSTLVYPNAAPGVVSSSETTSGTGSTGAGTSTGGGTAAGGGR